MRPPASDMVLGPLAERPSVSVVIPARHAASCLPRAVQSALTQECPGPLDAVIAVGPSDDATTLVASRLAAGDPRVRVVDNPAGVTPAALNAGIAASDGEVVVRLDAHAELPAGYIASAIAILRSTGAANVGGRQVPVAEGGFARSVALAMASPLGSGGARYRAGGRAGPVDTVYLGVFRREALIAVGGFDETLVRNQDYELNLRLRKAGAVVWFDPSLAVVYAPRATPRALWAQYFEYGAWKRRVLWRHPKSVRARQLAPPLLVTGLAGLAALAAVGGPRRPAAAAAGAYLTMVAAAALRAAGGWRQAAPVAAALVILHVAWGSGFVVGRAATGSAPR